MRVPGWTIDTIYEETISRTEIDPFERPDDYIDATRKHNRNRQALREVADEHFGSDSKGTD